MASRLDSRAPPVSLTLILLPVIATDACNPRFSNYIRLCRPDVFLSLGSQPRESLSRARVLMPDRRRRLADFVNPGNETAKGPNALSAGAMLTGVVTDAQRFSDYED